MNVAQVQDPVCGMTIEDSKAAATAVYKGRRYYFCSEDCRKKFDANPDKFAG